MADTLRASVRAELIAVGCPPASADEAVDLAFHAASEASAKIVEITKRASDPRITIQATLIASATVRARLAELESDVAAMAQKLGLATNTAVVGGSYDG